MTTRIPEATRHHSKLPSARLTVTISLDLHMLIKKAAKIQGMTLTQFVVCTLRSAASHAIEQAGHVRLSPAGQKAFAKALLVPPKRHEALERAFTGPTKCSCADCPTGIEVARFIQRHKAP